jgi:hypothetical protein
MGKGGRIILALADTARKQVGSVFLESEDYFLYCPNCADMVIRGPITWKEAAIGQPSRS